MLPTLPSEYLRRWREALQRSVFINRMGVEMPDDNNVAPAVNVEVPDAANVLGLPTAGDDQLVHFGADDKAQVASASAKLKEILRDMETAEGLAKLKSGDLEFKIKPGPGVLWYVAYGTS